MKSWVSISKGVVRGWADRTYYSDHTRTPVRQAGRVLPSAMV